MAGALRRTFGVCANVWSPSDGRVISLDHGCGAHSETDVEEPESMSIGVPIVDELAFDVEVVERSAQPDTGKREPVAEAQHGSDDPVTD